VIKEVKIVISQKLKDIGLRTKRNNMKKKHRDFEEYLSELLQDPKEALVYLNAALLDEDQRVFLVALKDVLQAQGGDISALADMSKLNRENLYRMLSSKGNPRFTSIRSVLNALGLQLAVQPHKTK
jgi:probable addiction module antidote protein